MRTTEPGETEIVDLADPIDAVVFDFDGVIADTEESVHRAWSEAFAAYESAFERSEWQALIGTSGSFDPYDWIVERSGLPVADRAEVKAQVSARQAELNAALVPLPGVESWIAAARAHGVALAVASSSSRRWVEGRLAQLGLLDAFDAVISAGGELRPKPEPDVYLAACRALGIATGRALAIEDSGHGVAAARAAGLLCVAVPNRLTSDLDFSAADHRVANLAEFSFRDTLSHFATPRARPPRDRTPQGVTDGVERGGAALLAALIAAHLGDRWSFRWDRAVRRFGLCRWDERIISLSRVLVELNDEDTVRDTVLHEIAHALAPRQAGHNRTWQRIARAIGAKPERSLDAAAIALPVPRFRGRCPSCGWEMGAHRRRRVACRRCCVVHNGGRFSVRFELVWAPVGVGSTP